VSPCCWSTRRSGQTTCAATTPRWRDFSTLALLNSLPSAPLLGQNEVLGLIERHALMGKGGGFVDIHLLASARVASFALWTRDRRLADAAAGLGVATRGGP
jgi:hypothetical protein